MSDHCEEQEMEAEALAAIFDTSFGIISPNQPFKWYVELVPIDCGGDEEEDAKQNHVGVKLIVDIPLTYPDVQPELDIEVVKGLAEEQRQEILDLAIAEAEANAGMPAVFAVCEAIRTWLADNNVKGQDDGSMYAQMMRRAKEAEREKAKAAQVFEAQKKQDQLSQAELEEMAVRKRRAEGTPCTKENFLIWLETWDEEMENKQEEEKEEEKTTKGKSKEKIVDYSTRMTGFEYFSGKGGLMNLDAIEAAVNEADEQAVDVDDLDVDEDLFDDDDDLDDLDFDESDEDDSDDEPEI
mmetsp:Transcript_25514/g.30880  ORF Transcript_25514/g.30880 Transcript_25514/m.30880 type:complete len:296 (+) Transcript_25514:164-1051(+)|eukprot:CAMPEP_0172484184 /NCGR_PEP_ID=MMETSP1066-20121228/11549_1 /TAXON_ID=671091 /ORGANISM="Coscinodiscus wailesii, Strain CCMP2513" /LENGTH=295 /DNA_ID=CAMNT_0013248527 /DNA_START=164 /DNA_END=1051 /DNA_ORIENTATION=-